MNAAAQSSRPTIPAAQARPAARGAAGAGKSAARRIVEQVLRNAIELLTPAEVAARSGLDIRETRRLLCNICKAGNAHNTSPALRHSATYKWGPAPVITTPRANPLGPQRRGTYDGRELQPFTSRPGAMDAFALPSLQGGERTARRPPALITSTPEPK